MYKDNQRIELELFETSVIIECEIDFNGTYEDSDVYIKTINGLPPYLFKKDELGKIEREVIAFEIQDTRDNADYKAEMRFDDDR